MSVRNTIKIISLAGAAVMLPGVVSAANPTFGDWTATTGTISSVGADCPTGFTCEVINSGDGFLQANVTETANPANTFVQTIITDAGASCNNTSTFCAFTDENFVKTDGTSNGISARQSANDTALNFTSSVVINTGWALTGPSTRSVDITQALSDDPDGTAATGDEFSTSFNLGVNLNSSGVQTGKSMNIGQDVALGTSTDSQVFDLRERDGNLSVAAGSTTLDGATADWVAGDDVMMAWISQDVDIGGAGSSLFAFQSLENKDGTSSTVNDLVSTFSTTANDPTAAPFEWGANEVSTFGAAP